MNYLIETFHHREPMKISSKRNETLEFDDLR